MLFRILETYLNATALVKSQSFKIFGIKYILQIYIDKKTDVKTIIDKNISQNDLFRKL
jgi:hypothetical protein